MGIKVKAVERQLKVGKELEALGLQPGARMLPPVVVKFIANKLDIDL